MDNSSLGKKPCRFFNRDGGCKKGDACEFLHEVKKSVPVCRFFAKGTCNKGDACEFKHVAKNSQKTCYFFNAGSCKKGEACDFKHIKLDVQPIGATAMDLSDK